MPTREELRNRLRGKIKNARASRTGHSQRQAKEKVADMQNSESKQVRDIVKLVKNCSKKNPSASREKVCKIVMDDLKRKTGTITEENFATFAEYMNADEKESMGSDQILPDRRADYKSAKTADEIISLRHAVGIDQQPQNQVDDLDEEAPPPLF